MADSYPDEENYLTESNMLKRKAQLAELNKSVDKNDLLNKKPRKKYTYPKKWQCPHDNCEKAFSSQANLLRHTFSHAEKKEVQCEWPGCHVMFKRQDKMREHYERHRSPNGLRRGRKSSKLWKCNYNDCEDEFHDAKLLNLHLAGHTNTPTFMCYYPGCNKSFLSDLRFKVHFEMHFAGEIPCSECGKMFTSKARLARHRLVHSGEKSFKCDYEGCSKSFARKDKLVDHYRVHTGEKPFKCPYDDCTKAFSDYSSRRTHVQMHLRDSNMAHKHNAYVQRGVPVISAVSVVGVAPAMRTPGSFVPKAGPSAGAAGQPGAVGTAARSGLAGLAEMANNGQ